MGRTMIKLILDSVILIDHLNSVKKASDFLEALDPGETAISVITRAEVLCGVDDAAFEDVSMLLDQYILLNLDKTAADTAARLRKEEGWKLPDAFQAALAQLHNTKLCTRNTSDFNPKKHTFVEVPYTL
ncbi:MAG: PIN domain nuclease [Deltaproteobacteria bacterium CG_4_8_14_3_um_filter_51_11]|nr:MAG: PIN domain nuclease [Deltaproteobacteria bacterium CG23_combo_of_CG06-09_8_20_14_all_51_20]PIX20795.1 MAG: PIN domain nuclease [Deltaproteobacteria bacterium CG_4_8_14_3_um_filter_51_11]PIY25889.1 MAG: PIN domain nuclease [Deltaproteobacteria bacterium CG_4_10_14_3_um_filter_51_14]PJB34532.1 MAG: PIN domain nuclease [Deltaproteobacteria bacterium CG_4_9_14_3_um_filter_51_14]